MSLRPDAHWPVLTCPQLAGFEVSTEAVSRSSETIRSSYSNRVVLWRGSPAITTSLRGSRSGPRKAIIGSAFRMILPTKVYHRAISPRFRCLDLWHGTGLSRRDRWQPGRERPKSDASPSNSSLLDARRTALFGDCKDVVVRRGDGNAHDQER